ncbi:MAG: hypothetical protein Q8P50_08540 [Bacillota bacterium]|nr:hypothetical protein [Bacillota bacterium]
MRRWGIVGVALALTLTTAALVTATSQIRLVVNGKEIIAVPVGWRLHHFRFTLKHF